MIMTGRYKVTGQNFYSSDFNSFAFVPQNGQTEKSPKYKGKNNSAGTDFDIIVRNRLPHYLSSKKTRSYGLSAVDL